MGRKCRTFVVILIKRCSFPLPFPPLPSYVHDADHKERMPHFEGLSVKIFKVSEKRNNEAKVDPEWKVAFLLYWVNKTEREIGMEGRIPFV